ncbi:MAG: hypothetical protein ACRCST_07730 [Turicibacter sp.]
MTRISKLRIVSLVMGMLFLVGCDSSHYKSLISVKSSYRTVLSVTNSTSERFEMSYKSFDGSRTKKVNFKEGEVVEFEIEMTTSSGDLKLSIVDPNGTILYETIGPDIEVTETMTMATTGYYSIKVEGDHSGSFKVRWTKK